MPAGVIVVAAGRGRRFGPSSRRPKQFRSVAGRPLLYWPLRAFQKVPAVSAIVLVVSEDRLGWARAFARRFGFSKISAVVPGGRERADSVRAGFRALPASADVVLVHDAARALVSRDVIDRVIRAARRTGAALAAWPVPDTLKAARPGRGRFFVKGTIPRGGLWLAQTPQGFRRAAAERVFARRPAALTDDVQAAERLGLPVALVRGSPQNFKVTVPEDAALCEALLKRRAGR